jgi:hypothetical protein
MIVPRVFLVQEKEKEKKKYCFTPMINIARGKSGRREIRKRKNRKLEFFYFL